MQGVQFFFHDRRIVIKGKKRLKIFIIDLFAKEKRDLDRLAYIFCSDKYLLEMNNRFLKHNFYTDVITFDLGSAGNGTEAEVYLSIDRIKDNAKKIGVPFNKELHRVIFHGALHLCGYKDKTKAQQKEMRSKENRYLLKYFNG